jgi:uncharacterized membrane protein YbaN (DUF454 family)
MVDEMCKKYNQLKNVERRWENEAMMEWDKFTITFMMFVTCLSFFWESQWNSLDSGVWESD